MRILAFISVVFFSALTGCSGIALEKTNTTSQELVLEEFFQGKTSAYGILFDRAGHASRHFNVELTGTWNEERQLLVLDEYFEFDDGEKSTRQWRISKNENGEYTGEADDVRGLAIGKTKGNALLWRYVLDIPYQGSTIAINFEDWMFLHQDTLVNRAIMRKFGFKVGEVLLSFKRNPDGSES